MKNRQCHKDSGSQREQQQTAIIPKWHFKADYVEACNCDYGYRVILMAFRPMVFAELLFCFQLERAIMAILRLMV